MDEGKCCCGSVNENEKKLLSIIEKYKNTRGGLIPVLHEAQEIYGYLPLDVQKTIATGLNVPLTEIYGVITFYTQFSLKPKGKYNIQVCLGTACYVKGASKIMDKRRTVWMSHKIPDCHRQTTSRCN